MADDRWKALCTHEDATPGPWFYNAYSDIFSKPNSDAYSSAVDALPEDAPDEAYEGLPEPTVASVPRSGGDTATPQGRLDARHIARWSPDVTAEIVELLREAEKLLDRTSGMSEEVATWSIRVDALLERVGGKRS